MPGNPLQFSSRSPRLRSVPLVPLSVLPANQYKYLTILGLPKLNELTSPTFLSSVVYPNLLSL
jgi:hypothetical protein